MRSAEGVGERAGPAAGLVVAGTHSGVGKTTVSGVIVRALRRAGLTVQPFKLGPDFIDPGYLTEAAGRPAINLDLWMMGAAGIRASYERWSAGADVAVVEAMGALFDGEDGTERGSAAHVARLLGLPVVVVIDVWGMTRTTGAVLEGMVRFDPGVEVAGCVLNRTGSATHERMILDGLAPALRRLVVGAVRRDRALEVPERHLGLVTVEENAIAPGERHEAAERAAEGLDHDRLRSLAGRRPPSSGSASADLSPTPSPLPPGERAPRIAVARDEAFCFTYAENLLLFERAGVEVVPFSPLADTSLPPDVDAVYLGGGYPESFAARLAANTSMAAALARHAAAGRPVHAECGGLVYLARSLTAFDGRRHAMGGLLAVDVAMDRDRLAIAYTEVTTLVATALGPAGTTVRGQEFHQSHVTGGDVAPGLYDLVTSDGRRRREGFVAGSVTASYVHLHLASNPAVAAHLGDAAVGARRGPAPQASRAGG